MIAHGPVHPLFVPPDLVHAVVMTTTVGDAGLVKVGVSEQGGERALASGRSSVDADTAEIHLWNLLAGFGDPPSSIGETGVD